MQLITVFILVGRILSLPTSRSPSLYQNVGSQINNQTIQTGRGATASRTLLPSVSVTESFRNGFAHVSGFLEKKITKKPLRKWRKLRLRIGPKYRRMIRKNRNFRKFFKDRKSAMMTFYSKSHSLEVLDAMWRLLSARSLSKKQINEINKTYINNTLILLNLEENIQKNGDSFNKAAKDYKSYVDRKKSTVLKNIHRSAMEFENKLNNSIYRHLERHEIWKNYMTNKLEEICLFLEDSEKDTFYKMKKAMAKSLNRISQLESEMKKIKNENELLRAGKRCVSAIKNTSEQLYIVQTDTNYVSLALSDLSYTLKTITFNWKLHEFEFESTHNSLTKNSPMYVKLSGYSSKGKYLGVVLESPKRYKLYIGDDLNKPFLSIWQRSDGHHQDECKLVNGKSTIDEFPFYPTKQINQGYIWLDWNNGSPQFTNPSKVTREYFTSQLITCNVTIP